MHIRFARAAATVPLLLIACGGRFADDTTGVPNDASDATAVASGDADGAAQPATEAGPSLTSSCSNDLLEVQQTGSMCTTSEKWSCGSDSYGFSCFCPQGTCECWHNGIPTKATGSLVQCPGCIEAQDAFAICGFPR